MLIGVILCYLLTGFLFFALWIGRTERFRAVRRRGGFAFFFSMFLASVLFAVIWLPAIAITIARRDKQDPTN